MYLKSEVGAASGIGRNCAHLLSRRSRSFHRRSHSGGCRCCCGRTRRCGQCYRHRRGIYRRHADGRRIAAAIAAFGSIDILVSNAGIQTVGPLDQFEFVKWKQRLPIHLDGAFLTTRAAPCQMYRQGTGGGIIYIGSVQSNHWSRNFWHDGLWPVHRAS